MMAPLERAQMRNADRRCSHAKKKRQVRQPSGLNFSSAKRYHTKMWGGFSNVEEQSHGKKGGKVREL
jgi:hypothetical protein